MKNVISSERLPIKLWLNVYEEGVVEQTRNLANLPFAFHHVALMPDAHQGYGMPIGGVLATKGVIIPNAVGVDIGCGMRAVKTSLRAEEFPLEEIKKVLGGSKECHGGIRSGIPVGFEHHSKAKFDNFMPYYNQDAIYPYVSKEYESARKQIGTLGGGNHFIELQKDAAGFIWFMIHSGSRNVGFKIANEYNRIAVELNEKYYSQVPKKWELAFLPFHSDEGSDYMREMEFCLEFAEANREVMDNIIRECLIEHFPNIVFDFVGDVRHNYVTIENHFGENVFIHRKGATSAKAGQLGIIPGSQGTKSYIVRGKGNPESFTSCSHGAGRKMSRTKAREVLNLDDEKKRMDDQGIIHGVRHKSDLDEVAGAYKDIGVVMANQADLVDIVVELTPIAVVKG
jgi:tRNA-splicing ligase RtcB